jgi:large subunit ribosomal protein L20
MTRIKRGTTANKRRKNVLKHTKGFMWGRKSKYKQAKEALLHAWTYAYRDRKVKKRTFRRLQQTKINAAVRKQGIPYNKLIHLLKEKKIELDRKTLSDLVENNPEIFDKVVEEATK